MTRFLLDLSHYQDGIDVAKAVGEGFDAVICKATEGTSYVDPCFTKFASAARRAGAIPGAYHFLRSGDGADQAEAFHTRVKAAGGPEGFLCVCDNEKDASWATTKAFFSRWSELTGGHPLIMYTGAWWWDATSRRWEGATLTPHLWHSHYVDGSGYASKLYDLVPDSWWSPGYGGWRTATILQFSSSARVAGRVCDVNAYRGTIGELRALTTSSKNAEDGVEQGDKLVVETGNDNRTVGQHFGDLQRLRGWLLGETGDSADVPPAGSPLGRIIAAVDAPAATEVSLTDEQLQALSSLVAADVAVRMESRLVLVERLASALATAGEAVAALND